MNNTFWRIQIRNYLTLAFAVTAPLAAVAATYKCDVSAVTQFKPDSAVELMAKDELRKRQQHVIVEDEKTPSVQRCSFAPSAGRVTCDRYEVDRVEVDRNVNIKKFYLFRAQFDVQLLGDLSFVENNGRGGVAYGTCKLTRP